MQLRVRTALLVGFSLIVGFFLLATATTVWSVNRVQGLEVHLAHLDHAKHQGHLCLADIQEQYIHQAHTMILGNQTHMHHYERACEAVQNRLGQLEDSCKAVGVTEGIGEIRQTVDEMHRYFMREVMPSLGIKDDSASQTHNARLEQLTGRARIQVLDLNSRLETQSQAAHGELVAVLSRTQATTVTMFTLAIAASITVGLVLVRMIGRPLTNLHGAFGRVGAGQLETRVTPIGPRELRDLALGFNEMAAALEEMQQQIAQKERMAVMGELAAGVAHELNNPLGVITGYLRIVREACTGDEMAEDLQIIAQEVLNCQEIVRGLLELSRPRKLERVVVDLAQLVQETIERIKRSAPDSAVTVHFEGKVELATASVDDSAMRRVFGNLLRNALDAAAPNGDVDVVVDARDGAVVVSVSDSGEGIAPELANDVFKPFTTTKSTGTGLGLSISDAIVKAHGGHIEVDAGSRGGARFRVVLPVEDPARNEHGDIT